MSVWTAPILTGAVKPTITAKPTASADMAIVALEYSGLSTVADITAVDQVAHAVGTTTAAATVNSTATAPTTARQRAGARLLRRLRFRRHPRGRLRLHGPHQRVPGRRHGDAGRGPAGRRWARRPPPAAKTGANTVWLMATVVFASSAQSVPRGTDGRQCQRPATPPPRLPGRRPPAAVVRSRAIPSPRTSAGRRRRRPLSPEGRRPPPRSPGA